MTCIVGLEYKDRVYIGGDVQGTSPNSKIIHTQPKVFKVGEIVFGYTTSYRFGQIIENFLPSPHVPEKSDEMYTWLVQCLVPDIKKTLESHGWNDSGVCLIGVKNELWTLQSEYSVLRNVNGYNAIGSGEEYAKASVYTSLQYIANNSKRNAQSIVERAIDCAGEFSPTVGKDCSIKST